MRLCNVRRWFGLVLVLMIAACGGGDPVPMVSQPKVEVLALTTTGGIKIRLFFAENVGFPRSVDVGDEVVWHSGAIHGDQPSAPRAMVTREDGMLHAEIVLNYTTDRGIFAAVPAGRVPIFANGQPTNSMVVGEWQLPNGMKAAPLNDGTGRVWLDVSF